MCGHGEAEKKLCTQSKMCSEITKVKRGARREWVVLAKNAEEHDAATSKHQLEERKGQTTKREIRTVSDEFGFILVLTRPHTPEAAERGDNPSPALPH